MAEAEGRLRARELALKDKEDRQRQRVDDELESRVRTARPGDRQGRRRPAAPDRQADRGGQPPRPARPVDPDRPRRARRGPTPARRSSRWRTGCAAPTRRSADEPAPGAAPRVGDRVLLRTLGMEGRVTAIYDGDVEIDVRGKRMRAHAGDVRVLGGQPASAAPARVNVNVRAGPRGRPAPRSTSSAAPSTRR